MFDAGDGLRFERTAAGGVRITVTDPHADAEHSPLLFERVLTESEWRQAMVAMTGRKDIAIAVIAAERLHNGGDRG